MLRRGVCSFVVLCVVVACAAPLSNVGVRTTVTQSGLDEFRKTLVGLINLMFQDIDLPDVTVDEDIPVVGHVTMEFKSIQLTNFQIKDSSIQLTPPNLAGATLGDIDFDLSLEFHWRKDHWPHISDHGDLTAKPNDGSISLTTRLASDKSGKLTVELVKDNASFSDMSIHVSGHWDSWLYNLIADIFKKKINGMVASKIEAALKTIVDDTLDKLLAKLPSSIEIGGGKTAVNVSLDVEAVNVTDSVVSIGNRWGVKDVESGAMCPEFPVVMPLTSPADDMLELSLADASLNCLLWVEYVNGAIDVILNNKTAPKFPLTTKEWGVFIPELAKKYPDSPMQIDMRAAAQPYLNTTKTDGIIANANLYLNASVITGNNTQAHVFVLGLTLTIGLDVTAQQQGPNATIKAQVSDLDLNLVTVQTSIGPIDTAGIDKLAQTFLPIVKDVLNDMLGKPLVLPTLAGLSFVDPNVFYDQGFMTVSTNFNFTLP